MYEATYKYKSHCVLFTLSYFGNRKMYTGVWKKDRKKTTICCRSVFPCMNLSLSKIYISKHHKSKRYKKLMIMLTKLYAPRADVTKYKSSYRLQ